jgi:hypothetical protein
MWANAAFDTRPLPARCIISQGHSGLYADDTALHCDRAMPMLYAFGVTPHTMSMRNTGECTKALSLHIGAEEMVWRWTWVWVRGPGMDMPLHFWELRS